MTNTLRLRTMNKDTYDIALRIAHEGMAKVPAHINIGVVLRLINEINRTTKNVEYKIEKDGIVLRKVNDFVLMPWMRKK